MAFSLKSLFRREQNEPNGIDRDQPAGARSTRPPVLADPGQPSLRHASEGGGSHVSNGSSSPFQMASGLPNTSSSTPMNLASPFQPAAEEGFTIRELSILLPPQLLNVEQLPPDYLIPLPMEALRATFLAGRPCLRLSQIFQSCPYLFNRQLMPGEDQEVSLPYQKVRRILEAGQALPERAVAGVQPASPFSIRQSASPLPPPRTPLPVPQAPADVVLSPMDSPFKMAAPVSLPASVAGPEPVPTAVAAASPFTLAPPQSAPLPLPAAPVPAVAHPASPFQLAPQAPQPQQSVAQPLPASPFALAERLPAAPAPRRDGPPAFPAPHSSSPFQIAQQPPTLSAPMPAPSPAPQVAAAMATPFATQSTTPAFPRPTVNPSAPAASPFAIKQAVETAPETSVPALGQPQAPIASPFSVVSAPSVPASPFTPVAVPRFDAVTPPLVAPPILPPVPVPAAVPPPLAPPAAIELPPVPPVHLCPPVAAVAPVALPPLPEPELEMAAKSEEVKEEITMRLASVLRSVSAEELGFDASNVPAAVLVSFPLSLIYPQLPSGKVQVGLHDIIQGVAEKFQPAFARASRNLRASLPLSELLHALPSGALPAAPAAPVEPAAPRFETPFHTKATEDAVRVPTPEPINLPSSLLPSFITAHDDLGDPRSAATLNDPPPSHLPLRGAVVAPQPVHSPAPVQIELPELVKPVGYLPPLPPLADAPNVAAPAPAAIEHPAEHLQLPPLIVPSLPVAPVAEILPMAPASEPESTPEPEPEPVMDVVTSQPAIEPEVPTEIPAPVPALPPSVPVPAPAPVSQDFQIGYKEHPAAMALRHWLQTSGTMTPSHAVGCVATIPGVRAAVLLAPYLMETAGASAEAEANFFEKSSLRHQSLKMMLENMGQPVQGSFTMRLDSVASTFFLEGEICLAVLQDEVSLAEELRDKLTLVTRELASLTNS